MYRLFKNSLHLTETDTSLGGHAGYDVLDCFVQFITPIQYAYSKATMGIYPPLILSSI